MCRSQFPTLILVIYYIFQKFSPAKAGAKGDTPKESSKSSTPPKTHLKKVTDFKTQKKRRRYALIIA